MKILYDPIRELWSHSESESQIFWGAKNERIEYVKSGASRLPFYMTKQNERVGPLIGILTSEGKNSTAFMGNSRNFKRITHEVEKHGGIVIIFTPDGFTDQYINGFLYLKHKKQWLKVKTPLPDVVYNRIPFRKKEQNPKTKEIFKKVQANHIPFFNPYFLDKWNVYQALRKHERLLPFLPKTKNLTNLDALAGMVEDFQHVYLKPANGQKGNGICSINKNKEQIIFKTHHYSQKFSSLESFWQEHHHWLLTKNYIIQKKITLVEHEGCSFDFRILAHYLQSTWEISGIGVRQAKTNALTTHVPKGGNILPFTPFKNMVNLHVIRDIVQQTGDQLQQSFGSFREFSMDLGMTPDQHYAIFEVNAKPMVFDEEHIRHQGLANLIKIFYEVSGFALPATQENK